MELSLIQNCPTRNVEVGDESLTDTEDPGRRWSKKFCTKKKQSDQNDPYRWY